MATRIKPEAVAKIISMRALGATRLKIHEKLKVSFGAIDRVLKAQPPGGTVELPLAKASSLPTGPQSTSSLRDGLALLRQSRSAAKQGNLLKAHLLASLALETLEGR